MVTSVARGIMAVPSVATLVDKSCHGRAAHACCGHFLSMIRRREADRRAQEAVCYGARKGGRYFLPTFQGLPAMLYVD